jgi:DNA-directed RNA polymerase specialized sigma24 family protein
MTPRAYGGDVAAFSELMEVRSGLVRGIALRVLGAEDAEDVYQEVWIRMWRSIGGFLGERLRHLAL